MTREIEFKHIVAKETLDKTLVHLDSWVSRSFMSDTGFCVKSSMILMTGNAGITIDLNKKTTQLLIDALEKNLDNICMQEAAIQIAVQAGV